jgi:hypothetical protein
VLWSRFRAVKIKERLMTDYTELNAWWRKELQRSFTKLECGLLGALFTAITIILMMLMRFEVG